MLVTSVRFDECLENVLLGDILTMPLQVQGVVPNVNALWKRESGGPRHAIGLGDLVSRQLDRIARRKLVVNIRAMSEKKFYRPLQSTNKNLTFFTV